MKKRRSKHAQRLGFNLFHEPRMKLDFGPPKGGGFGGLFKAPKGNNWLNTKPHKLSFAPPKSNLSLGMPSGNIFGQPSQRRTKRVRLKRRSPGIKNKGINYEKINKVGSSVAGALSKLPSMLKSKKKVEAEEHEKREEAESGYHNLTKEEMEKR